MNVFVIQNSQIQCTALCLFSRMLMLIGRWVVERWCRCANVNVMISVSSKVTSTLTSLYYRLSLSANAHKHSLAEVIGYYIEVLTTSFWLVCTKERKRICISLKLKSSAIGIDDFGRKKRRKKITKNYTDETVH